MYRRTRGCGSPWGGLHANLESLRALVAVAEQRHLKDVAAAARPFVAEELDEVFSLDATVAELAPVLEEELAALGAAAAS